MSRIRFDKNWTLFLDRDGVINQRPLNDYVKKTEDFVFLPGVIEALRLLSSVFGKIVVVTNQQGVGLGLMNSETLHKIHQLMLEGVSDGGGRIDLVLACTETRDQLNNCRKPSTAMADEAAEKIPSIRFAQSVMVGDTETDIQFGKNAGMQTVLIGSESIALVPDLKFYSLYQFAKYCINQK